MIRKGLLVGAVAALVGAPAAYAFPPSPIDMTIPEAEYTSLIDGTIWRNLKGEDGEAIQPAGTGVYDPFLREQATGGDGGIEYGMNTDGTVAEPLDNVGNDPHTHSVLFGDLATVTIGATEYYAFSLDLNEPAGDGQNYLSLDQIKIYSVDGSAGGSLLTEAAVLAATGGTLQYDMDDSNLDGNHTAGENQTTWLDYTNSNQDKDLGSGEDDMTVFIPTSFFAGVEATDYMYFLATFGSAGNVSDQSWYGEDGFEEWRVLSGGGGGGGGGGGAPEPGTLALLGIGLAGIAIARRK